MTQSWKPEVQVAGESGTWHKNGLVFATEQEAADNARALMGKWIMVRACRAVPSQDAVNYKWVEDHLERVEEPVAHRQHARQIAERKMARLTALADRVNAGTASEAESDEYNTMVNDE